MHVCYLLLVLEKNNLSFIETSALDSTNVEPAFQQILTGERCDCGRLSTYLCFGLFTAIALSSYGNNLFMNVVQALMLSLHVVVCVFFLQKSTR